MSELPLHHLRAPDTHRAVFRTVGEQPICAKYHAIDLYAMINGLQLTSLVDIPQAQRTIL